MKQVTALKLTCVSAFVAALGVGCASSGTASYDVNSSDKEMSASASANTGTETIIRAESDGKVETGTLVEVKDRDVTVVNADPEIYVDQDAVIVDTDTDRGARVTVSALASSPETRATWVNRFPFSASSPQMRSIETYTFAVPSDVDVVDANAPEFRADLPAGSVFVEAAGGAGEVRTGRVIQHSPNPTR
jgi:hypothetical protein